jgi:hypothetical protein
MRLKPSAIDGFFYFLDNIATIDIYLYKLHEGIYQMTINVDLLEETLETVKANLKHWFQPAYHCLTFHCFAGFAELLAFGLPIDSQEHDLVEDERIYNMQWNTLDNARTALGIEEKDAEILFAGKNSLEDLESMVNLLIKNGTLVGNDDE